MSPCFPLNKHSLDMAKNRQLTVPQFFSRPPCKKWLNRHRLFQNGVAQRIAEIYQPGGKKLQNRRHYSKKFCTRAFCVLNVPDHEEKR